MPTSFISAFDHFVEQYIAQSTKQNKGLVTEYDSQWPSDCLSVHNDASDGDEIAWKPHLRKAPASMENLNAALEIQIPQSLEQFFGRYFSLDLNALHPRGPVTLLQVYNEQDYERLQKNLIAHVLMKRRLKQPETLFFALTDEEDFIISIELESQAVVLERVGKDNPEVLAPDLASFIAALTPQPQLVTL
ncbi:SecY-interacting protein [Glaciecola sp. XM2]|uniref:SecY-interacting protein n=1 Tax=Glaciecola sp. XM2 TaxID=1914931 RepID=UPI001BDE3600|nr:SecY-interacting protein [Glaciecola sp. XM2]MBT1450718.1 SecY-interacting protein [Glaciecola sp. XM2]